MSGFDTSKPETRRVLQVCNANQQVRGGTEEHLNLEVVLVFTGRLSKKKEKLKKKKKVNTSRLATCTDYKGHSHHFLM